MKTLRESLFSKKNLDKNRNPYGITEKDIKGQIEGFPIGVVVRMMEKQEAQGNTPDVTVFQKDISAGSDDGGFAWNNSVDGLNFWNKVIRGRNFDLFFEKYPEYEIYN